MSTPFSLRRTQKLEARLGQRITNQIMESNGFEIGRPSTESRAPRTEQLSWDALEEDHLGYLSPERSLFE